MNRRQSSTGSEDLVIFLGGISALSTQESIKARIEKEFGLLTRVELPLSNVNGFNKGYAKLGFENLEDARSLLQKNYVTIDGFQVTVKQWVDITEHILDKEAISDRKVFVRYHPSITEGQLRCHFAAFGQIEVIDMMRERQAQHDRCFCFITFATRQGASGATALKRHRLNGRVVRCTIAQPLVCKKVKAAQEVSDFRGSRPLAGCLDLGIKHGSFGPPPCSLTSSELFDGKARQTLSTEDVCTKISSTNPLPELDSPLMLRPFSIGFPPFKASKAEGLANLSKSHQPTNCQAEPAPKHLHASFRPCGTSSSYTARQLRQHDREIDIRQSSASLLRFNLGSSWRI